MILKVKWIALFLALAVPASAGSPVFDLPIDCELGRNCFVEDYVDVNPTANQSDYTCGIKSRDGHSGTDFVLDTFETMDAGVSVLAAARGTVEAIRDGVPDQPVTEDNIHQIKGRECGNAVRVDHGDGWQTLYCHMANGSVRVKPGDVVETGDILGLIGLSGQTNVPHVHFAVLKKGTIVDPFQPNPDQSCERQVGNGLWRNAPEYISAGLFTAGFSTSVPSFDAVRSGAARRLTGTSTQPIVLYGHVFFAEAGDILTFSATGPDGEIFAESVEIAASKADLFHAFGKKSPPDGWAVGPYRGYVILKRNGRLLAARHADFTVDP